MVQYRKQRGTGDVIGMNTTRQTYTNTAAQDNAACSVFAAFCGFNGTKENKYDVSGTPATAGATASSTFSMSFAATMPSAGSMAGAMAYAILRGTALAVSFLFVLIALLGLSLRLSLSLLIPVEILILVRRDRASLGRTTNAFRLCLRRTAVQAAVR